MYRPCLLCKFAACDCEMEPRGVLVSRKKLVTSLFCSSSLVGIIGIRVGGWHSAVSDWNGEHWESFYPCCPMCGYKITQEDSPGHAGFGKFPSLSWGILACLRVLSSQLPGFPVWQHLRGGHNMGWRQGRMLVFKLCLAWIPCLMWMMLLQVLPADCLPFLLKPHSSSAKMRLLVQDVLRALLFILR